MSRLGQRLPPRLPVDFPASKLLLRLFIHPSSYRLHLSLSCYQLQRYCCIALHVRAGSRRGSRCLFPSTVPVRTSCSLARHHCDNANNNLAMQLPDHTSSRIAAQVAAPVPAPRLQLQVRSVKHDKYSYGTDVIDDFGRYRYLQFPTQWQPSTSLTTGPRSTSWPSAATTGRARTPALFSSL